MNVLWLIAVPVIYELLLYALGGRNNQTWGLDLIYSKRKNMGVLPLGTQMWQGTIQTCTCVYNCVCVLCVLCVYIYGYNGITCFIAPTQSFQIFYMCTFQRCCAVHVSQQLCTFHRRCARFTRPLITFVFNCIHTERILISKSIGATKHVLSI